MCAQASPSLSRQERITELVVRKTLWLLLRDGGMDRIEVLRMVDPDPGGASTSLSERDKEEAELAEKAARKIHQLIQQSSSNIVHTIEEYERDGWILTIDNVHSQFAEVARTLFADAVNWGRIVAFHGFAASYCIYAVQKGIQLDIVESVCGWTIHCLHRELKRWFSEHPWDQFASYADKVQLARSNGVHQHPDPTIMDTIRGLGKVGVAIGALTVLVWSVKEALS